MDIIKIFDNIYICNYNCNKMNSEFNHYGITNIININNYKIDNQNYNTLNVIINDEPIDYNTINDFILFSIKQNTNIVICDENYSLSFLILISFCVKILKMNFTYSIYYMQRKTNIDFRNVSKQKIFELFEYFKK